MESDNNRVTLDIRDLSAGGAVAAIASKSHAHRLLIAAALSDTPVQIEIPQSSEDIDATINCLIGLGADIDKNGKDITVHPIFAKDDVIPQIDCGESGSTLRFLMPVIGILGTGASITMHGKLPERPLSPLYEQMDIHGVTLSPKGSNPLIIEGNMFGGHYLISGDISSQAITGLLFALPLAETDSIIHVTGQLMSRPYVDLTLSVLQEFGINIDEKHYENGDTIFTVPGNQIYHTDRKLTAESDWSNAAFFLAAGALSSRPITVTGCYMDSLQGDREILDILSSFGADISYEQTSESPRICDVTVTPRPLKAITIDAENIPDLVPILSVVGALAEGRTIIKNVERLRIKESDRVQTVVHTLSALGANIHDENNSIIIVGSQSLKGGTISSFNDHRIAMSAAIASIRCEAPVTIENALAVRKSYPLFYEDMRSLLSVDRTVC